jgi:penicillin-binding protein 1A
VKIPGVNIAGKTGTTNFDAKQKAAYNVPSGAAKDAWFVGYNPTYTAAVWTGYNISKESEKVYLNSSDQKLARAIFKKIFSEIAADDDSDFEQPDSVVKKAVEIGSSNAVLAGNNTPSNRISYEYFVKGSEPSKVSKKYDKPAKPAKPANLSVNYDEASNSVSVNWSYDEGALGSVSFEVSQSVDGGQYQVVSNSKNMSYQIADVTPGATYSFQVVAVSDNDSSNRSKTAATKIQVPGAVEEEPEVEEPEVEEPEVEEPEIPEIPEIPGLEGNEGNENEQSNNDEQKNNNQGNDNGNGTDNGNANGNGNENNNNNSNTNGNGKPNDNSGDGATTPTPPPAETSTPPQNSSGKEEDIQPNGDNGEGE